VSAQRRQRGRGLEYVSRSAVRSVGCAAPLQPHTCLSAANSGARWSRAIAGLSLVANLVPLPRHRPAATPASPPERVRGISPPTWNQSPSTRVQSAGGGYGGSMPSKPPDEREWLERAREARLQADQLTTPDAKRIMLEIAAGYQRLAQYAEERTGRRKPRSIARFPHA
jgi:hypothetical protein